MAEYIEREAAIEEAIDAVDEWSGGYNPHRAAMIRDGINIIPAADVVPVRHGRWIRKIRTDLGPKLNDIIGCSECEVWFSTDDLIRRSYCPNCGAKMDLEGQT